MKITLFWRSVPVGEATENPEKRESQRDRAREREGERERERDG